MNNEYEKSHVGCVSGMQSKIVCEMAGMNKDKKKYISMS